MALLGVAKYRFQHFLGDTGNQNLNVDQEGMEKTAEERRMKGKALKLMIKV